MNKEQELQKLGKRIKEVRTRLGITQAELASRANKDQQSIQRLEAGRVNPSYFYLFEICNGLGVHLKEIIEN